MSEICLLPRFESIHLISTGARRRECLRLVPFVLTGCSWYDRRRFSSLCFFPAAAPSQGQLLDVAAGCWAVHGLVGNVSVTSVSVVHRGVDAAVIGSPFVEKVAVRIWRVAEAASTSSLASHSSFEPALVAVAAGGVAGQSVTTWVAGILSLTLKSTQENKQTQTGNGEEAPADK